MEGLLYKQREKMPVAFLINGRSGGKTGKELIAHFSNFSDVHVFNLEYLWDAASGKCQSEEYTRFCDVLQMDSVRIVAGGGDGTVAFVCGLIDHFFGQNPDNLPHKTQLYGKACPPIAILPIGVGNELARCLGWSKGYTPTATFNMMGSFCCLPDNKEKTFVQNVRKGDVVSLDSWNIKFEPDSIDSTSHNGKTGIHSLLCFFSLGFDASITHKFHQFRESNPNLTSTVAGNKLLYTAYGIQEMFKPMENVHTYLELRVDGKFVPLPRDIKTLQIFNIHSSADGIDFFGVSRPSDRNELQEFSSPTINDGLLEAVGTNGVPHLLTIRAGMSHSTRLAQGNTFTVRILKPIPVQLDGEGWIQPPGVVTITHRRGIPMICGEGTTKGF